MAILVGSTAWPCGDSEAYITLYDHFGRAKCQWASCFGVKHCFPPRLRWLSILQTALNFSVVVIPKMGVVSLLMFAFEETLTKVPEDAQTLTHNQQMRSCFL